MFFNRYLLVATVVATVLFAELCHESVKADPRMETRDGFCHFQIDPNDADVEVFAGVCPNSIFVYDVNGHDEADGDAVWVKQYFKRPVTGNVHTPIGNVNYLKMLRDTGQELPKRCRNQVQPANPMGNDANDLLCRVRLTGEQTGYDCALVDSNGNQYDTQFWTAVYELTADGVVKYSLSCRNAQKTN